MISLKIFSDNQLFLLENVLRIIEKNNLGVEVAEYGGVSFPRDFISWIARFESSKKMLHSNHSSVAFAQLLLKTDAAMDQYQKDIESCKKFGINKMVIHGFTTFGDQEPNWREFNSNPLECAKNWQHIVQDMNEVGIVPYLENTYEPLDWFEEFFGFYLDKNEKIGFCFDVGHVRAFPSKNNTLENWRNFVGVLRESKIPRHFHIHANNGIKDQHIPLSKAENFLLPTTDWAPTGFMDFLSRIMKENNDSLFCLENAAQYAEENYNFTVAELLNRTI